MFRPMRRKKQALSAEECAQILHRGTSGVLALAGDDGYPYAVPVSYAYDGDKLYFHCAKSGHKLDAISAKRESVLLRDRRGPGCAGRSTPPIFESVIAFGPISAFWTRTARTKRAAIEKLAVKYAPRRQRRPPSGEPSTGRVGSPLHAGDGDRAYERKGRVGAYRRHAAKEQFVPTQPAGAYSLCVRPA